MNIYRVIEFGIDWLTVTTDKSSVTDKLLAIYAAATTDIKNAGGKESKNSRLGYDGTATEHSFIGYGKQGCMMVVSSFHANDYAKQILETGAKVTRIDFQVTVRLDEPNDYYARNLMLIAEDRAKEEKGGVKPKFLHIDSRGRGNTLQIGSRASLKFGRIYDKGKQSGEDIYENCWRYEIEYKGKVAVDYANKYLNSTSKSYPMDIVLSQLESWLIETNINYNEQELVQYRRSSYATDKALHWLAKQVSPSIKRLRESGIGLEEILSVLGIDRDNFYLL